MKRAEVLQGLRQMKFEEILERAKRRRLSQAEVASILGMSERTFRRWRGRFEAEGAEGLYDRRLGKVSGHRVPVDTVMEVLELFDTRYWDFTAKHFHENQASRWALTSTRSCSLAWAVFCKPHPVTAVESVDRADREALAPNGQSLPGHPRSSQKARR